MLIDTHVHLGDERFDEDREDVMARAAEAGVSHIVEIADAPNEWDRAIALSRARPEIVRCTLGLHPYYADQWTPELGEKLVRMAALPEVVGAGEIGLDYYKHSTVPRDQQKIAMRGMLDAAWKAGLPIVVHSRDSNDDIVAILEEFYSGKDVPEGRRFFGVVHCFSGDVSHARRLADLHFALGVDGPVTYPKNDSLREALQEAGLDALVLETDSPWLPPQSTRGKRNEPRAIAEIAERLMPLFGLKKDEVAGATSRNARDLFALPD
ncbi:MAG: hydrolase TatD [Elusimicrobia bacterium]|nr:MAG: hydrolase TatD [Elusimicrobiota bacterium]